MKGHQPRREKSADRAFKEKLQLEQNHPPNNGCIPESLTLVILAYPRTNPSLEALSYRQYFFYLANSKDPPQKLPHPLTPTKEPVFGDCVGRQIIFLNFLKEFRPLSYCPRTFFIYRIGRIYYHAELYSRNNKHYPARRKGE